MSDCLVCALVSQFGQPGVEPAGLVMTAFALGVESGGIGDSNHAKDACEAHKMTFTMILGATRAMTEQLRRDVKSTPTGSKSDV